MTISRVSSWLVATALAGALVSAPSAAGAADLATFTIGGSWGCGQAEQVPPSGFIWTNNTTKVARLTKAQLFATLPSGFQAVYQLTLFSPGTGTITRLWMDHYTSFTSVQHHESDFAPDYFSVPAGQTVRLQILCTYLTGSGVPAFIATVWYYLV